jgi:hypothetical protein
MQILVQKLMHKANEQMPAPAQVTPVAEAPTDANPTVQS